MTASTAASRGVPATTPVAPLPPSWPKRPGNRPLSGAGRPGHTMRGSQNQRSFRSHRPTHGIPDSPRHADRTRRGPLTSALTALGPLVLLLLILAAYAGDCDPPIAVERHSLRVSSSGDSALGAQLPDEVSAGSWDTGNPIYILTQREVGCRTPKPVAGEKEPLDRETPFAPRPVVPTMEPSSAPATRWTSGVESRLGACPPILSPKRLGSALLPVRSGQWMRRS